MDAYFVIDVKISTHDLLKEGIVMDDWHRILISADEVNNSGLDAEALAALMPISRGLYCTGAQCIDWPDDSH